MSHAPTMLPVQLRSRTDVEAEITRRLAAERARLEREAGIQSRSVHHFQRPVELPFTADQRDRVTILIGGLTWKHDALVRAALQSAGYRVEVMPTPDVAAFQIGKEYGNNGQCNPTYFTVGNLIQYLQWLETQGISRQRHPRQLRLLHSRFVWSLPLRHVRSRVPLCVAERRIRWLPHPSFPADSDGLKASSGEPGLKFNVISGWACSTHSTWAT